MICGFNLSYIKTPTVAVAAAPNRRSEAPPVKKARPMPKPTPTPTAPAIFATSAIFGMRKLVGAVETT